MKETLIKGTFGTIIPILASITPQEMEPWFRVTSAALGCVVGILTIIGIVRRLRKPL